MSDTKVALPPLREEVWEEEETKKKQLKKHSLSFVRLVVVGFVPFAADRREIYIPKNKVGAEKNLLSQLFSLFLNFIHFLPT